jgi:hypothetical protein
MKNKKYVSGLLALVAVVTLSGASPAFADENSKSGNLGVEIRGGMMGRGMGGDKMKMMRPVVFGKVTAVSGNTITVSGTNGFSQNATNVTYTVDATNAKIMKNKVAGTMASIVVGDTIMAEGTLTGTNLVATVVHDGLPPMDGKKGEDKEKGDKNKNREMLDLNITGNGQPIIAGTVVSVTGNSVVITNKSNVSYTVDATNAKIVKGPAVATIASVAVGDSVIVQGTVNGNAVVAASLIDQTKVTASGSVAHKGFFGGMGSFFAKIFGF